MSILNKQGSLSCNLDVGQVQIKEGEEEMFREYTTIFPLTTLFYNVM